MLIKIFKEKLEAKGKSFHWIVLLLCSLVLLLLILLIFKRIDRIKKTRKSTEKLLTKESVSGGSKSTSCTNSWSTKLVINKMPEKKKKFKGRKILLNRKCQPVKGKGIGFIKQEWNSHEYIWWGLALLGIILFQLELDSNYLHNALYLTGIY